MKSNYTSINFKKWLDKLQQESWQLELLISGVSILGLFTALEPLQYKINEASVVGSPYRYIFSFLNTSFYILIMNLVSHVVLRGLWIGAIGLRYVSGDIDYATLKYSKKFTDYLSKKVGSFDRYISKLEDLCSILFAMTFLVLFYFISFLIFMFLMAAIINFFATSNMVTSNLNKVLIFLFLTGLLFSYLIVFFDFITQGLLKKKKWTSTLYLPLYKVFSILTLSFLYRPLVYNFLDNKFGKKVLLILMPLYIGIGILSGMKNIQSNYVSHNNNSSTTFSHNKNYLSLMEENQYVNDVAINSKIIEKSYLKVFVVFKDEIENIIFQKDSNLKPEKDRRGVKNIFFNLGEKNNQNIDSIEKVYLNIFNKVYQLKIDSTSFSSDFISTKLNKQLGFETVLPLKDISEGKHILRIDRTNFTRKEKNEITEKVIEIPFWYYKN